jgi:hypothetical protein
MNARLRRLEEIPSEPYAVEEFLTFLIRGSCFDP